MDQTNPINRRDLLLPAAAVAAAAVMAAGDAAAQDWQPRMQAALNDLRQAKASLEAARHNKGGHRVRAIRLIDQAIDQVQTGIRVGA